MTNKIDFKKALDSYQAPRSQFQILHVPDLQYLMIDGCGDPNASPSFATAIEALYPVAYRVKFASKAELGRDYVVPPLEGLWWAEDMAFFTAARDKSRWSWTLLLMVPDWISQAMFTTAVEQAGVKKKPARLDDVRLKTLSEGQCVQTLHVGSFDDEADVLARMHQEFIVGHGFQLAGDHHEIYLSDFRRVAPAKQRTILRQPVTTSSAPVA
jgi:hypothetical protein